MEQEFKISQDYKKRLLITGFVLVLFFLFFVYYGIQVWQDPSSTFFRKYISIPWFLLYVSYLAVPNFYNAFNMKIAINKEYIKYEVLGMVTEAKWSDLVEIKKYGLGFLNEEVIPVQKWNSRKNTFGLAMQPYNHIPIYYFGKHWRDSDLGQQIKQHAPHLFEK
jgi:hypothetical protein